MDGSLVIISIIDLLMSLVSEGSPRIFNILRVSEDYMGCKSYWPGYWPCKLKLAM